LFTCLGSKPWLIAQALAPDDPGSDSKSSKIYSKSYTSSSSSQITPIPNTNSSDTEFQEDKFHIKLPANVDPYTGLPLNESNNSASNHVGIDDTGEFPEDRFHRQDATSSYIIQQREQALKEKQMKYEK